MHARSSAPRLALCAVLVTGSGFVGATDGQQSQVPGALRTGITVVPIDVRVLDRNKRPVTDLTEEDFRIEEDGVAQQIRYFSTHALTPESIEREDRPTLRRAQDDSITPRNRRTFLIVLGRGRLQHPARATDALISFVRERLLPQDQVAVLAYNRATDFTIEHEPVAKLLERFRRTNDRLDTKLREHFTGLRAIYGSSELPAHIQTDIDYVFYGPEGPPSRRLPRGRITDAGRITDDAERSREAIQRQADAQRAAAALQREEILEDRPANRRGLTEVVDDSTMIDLSFDEYVQNYARTMTDLNNIYSGIEYLRYLDGEKHLVFVSESGLFLPRLENDQSIASLASDARVVIDTIHAGGTPALRFIAPAVPAAVPAGRATLARAPQLQTPWDDTFSIQSLGTVAALTGGQASLGAFADRGLARLDEATRFQYLIGYSPSNGDWDGEFRRIRVTVNRPGLTVLHRRGYFGNRQLVPYDRRQFVTYSRIATAGHHTLALPDIGVTLKRAALDIQGDTHYAVADAVIDVTRVAFAMVDGRQTASLQVAVFCGDEGERLAGDLWQTIDLRLTPETYQRVMKDGLAYTARVPLTGDPRHLKVIVYDYAADLVGSAVTRIRP